MVQTRKVSAGIYDIGYVVARRRRRLPARILAAFLDMPLTHKLAGFALIVAGVNMGIASRNAGYNARLAVAPSAAQANPSPATGQPSMVETGSLADAPADKMMGRLNQSVQTILAEADGSSAPPPNGRFDEKVRIKGNGAGHPAAKAGPDLPTWMDPSLDPYQKDADRKLKQERDEEGTSKVPAAVAANPDDYVVLCAAGCRPSSDRIVYKVSKIAAPAAEIAKSRLVTTSAEASDGSGDPATAENMVVCVAGCYDDEQSPKPTKQAEAKPAAAPAHRAKPAVRLAEVAPPALKRAHLKLKLKAVPVRDARPTALAALAPQPLKPAVEATVVAVREADVLPPASRVAGAPVKLADAHLVSTEARAHAAAKRVKAVVAKSSVIPKWRTVITRYAAMAPESHDEKARPGPAAQAQDVASSPESVEPRHGETLAPLSKASAIADAWRARDGEETWAAPAQAWQTAVTREIAEQAWSVEVVPATTPNDVDGSAPAREADTFGDIVASISGLFEDGSR